MTNQHLAAWDASIAASQSNVQIAAVSDSILTILNNDFIVPQAADVLWAIVSGTSLARARLNTPKFRYIGLPYFAPSNLAATFATYENVYDGRNYPFRVNPVDAIRLEASTDASGTARVYGAMLFSWGVQAVNPGPMYRLRATGTITGVADAWANGSLTFDQPLPAGRYAVCGMDCIGANLLFARLIFPGSAWRPGVFCRNALSNIKHPILEPGSVGVLGEFESITQPNLEIFAAGANSAQEVYLDLQMIREGSTA